LWTKNFEGSLKGYGLENRSMTRPKYDPAVWHYQASAKAGHLVCELDGEYLDTELRCRQCGILVGPAHFTKSVNEAGLCWACEDMMSSRERRWDEPYG
jgi:hypothetical protein